MVVDCAILAFVGLMASSIAGAIEEKRATGTRIWNTPTRWAWVCGVILFMLCFAAFIGSFYLPNDGWGENFTGPGSSEFSTTVSDGDTDE